MAVTRRRVLYIPGYDPIPPRRYRELYRREGAEQARIAGYTLAFGARSDRTGFGWGVTGQFAASPQTEAEVEVLVWSDVVARSMGHSIATTYGQLVRTAWIYSVSGALAAMMRLRRGPVLAALYPVVVLIVQAALACAAGLAMAWLAARLLPWWAALVPGLAALMAVLIAGKRLDGRLFAHYLMHDYAFTARLHGTYPPELQARITVFADRVQQVLEGDWDEVLVVGHSSGAYLAVSVLAEVIQRQGTDARLALLTLGHVVPMAAFLPKAQRLRGDLVRIAASATPWVDVSAPGDSCCFGLCDPVATCGPVPEGQGPLVLSAAFSHTLSPERRAALKHRWFRLHFQYLCAFDHPENYDYFAITAGPLTLAERFAGRHHSPRRISRAVSPHQDRA